jgi:hypothetical protein
MQALRAYEGRIYQGVMILKIIQIQQNGDIFTKVDIFNSKGEDFVFNIKAFCKICEINFGDNIIFRNDKYKIE